MKTLIVGGNIASNKKSSIILKMSKEFKDVECYNGILPKTIKGKQLVIWAPDIENTKDKNYPKKEKGNILICSKVMRDGYTHVDSVSRIFKMQGNGVIEIYKKGDLFLFSLRDALNNCWCDKTTSIHELCVAIKSLYEWTKKSIRKSLNHKKTLNLIDSDIDISLFYKFIQINKDLTKKVANHCGNRFFGNYSTRCTKLFPSMKSGKNLFIFSPRNVDKKYITVDDRVVCDYENYYGNIKPSVDTPIQLEIYKMFSNINYIIHGHAFIEDAVETENYFPCGDLREFYCIEKLLPSNNFINLKNHGFLIAADNLNELKKLIKDLNFISIV